MVGSLLSHTLEASIEAALHVASTFPSVAPLPRVLAAYRRGLAEQVSTKYRARVTPLVQAILERDPEALESFDAVVSEALDEMRAARPNGVRRTVAALDRVVYRNEPEYLDDPAFPMPQRVNILDRLDGLNRHLRSYDNWIDLIGGLIERARKARAATGSERPVTIHDLAAGHGGFALALKERLGDQVAVTASDLVQEYLELGRQRARDRHLDVQFVQQDATDLCGLEKQDVDIVVCTQSLHHFPAGMVARMLGEAARVARVGVAFIDGERGLVPLILATSAMAAYSRSWPAAHDTFVSLRRMPLAEELLLLASLAPGLANGMQIEAARRAPGYAYVMLTRP